MNNQKCVNQLKKENEHAQGKIKLLLKSCKQLEEEKKMLQKELSQLEATREKHKSGTVSWVPLAKLFSDSEVICLGCILSLNADIWWLSGTSF